MSITQQLEILYNLEIVSEGAKRQAIAIIDSICNSLNENDIPEYAYGIFDLVQQAIDTYHEIPPRTPEFKVMFI